MARKILKKIIDLGTRIGLTVNFNATPLKLAEKFDHPFSHLFKFRYVFAQGDGFDAVKVAWALAPGFNNYNNNGEYISLNCFLWRLPRPVLCFLWRLHWPELSCR